MSIINFKSHLTILEKKKYEEVDEGDISQDFFSL